MAYFDYIVADIRIRSGVDIVKAGLKSFSPFATDANNDIDADCTFTIDVDMSTDSYCIERVISEFTVTEANASCKLLRTSDGYLYSVKRSDKGVAPTLFYINRYTNTISTNIVCNDNIDHSILRFGLWIMFGIVLVSKGAIAIHSSVIESSGKCVLFLGESGTGKSTHTRLWRENIEGAKLLNDDSPIIRVQGSDIRVYGSPWSGKTPCYKNLSYPIAGFCRLSQAPHNKIRQLHRIAAIGALLPSCPPAFAHDEYLQDCICSTLGVILQRIPVYHLECLPNADAAYLSHSTILRNA